MNEVADAVAVNSKVGLDDSAGEVSRCWVSENCHRKKVAWQDSYCSVDEVGCIYLDFLPITVSSEWPIFQLEERPFLEMRQWRWSVGSLVAHKSAFVHLLASYVWSLLMMCYYLLYRWVDLTVICCCFPSWVLLVTGPNMARICLCLRQAFSCLLLGSSQHDFEFVWLKRLCFAKLALR